MCGFLVTSRNVVDLEYLTEFLRNRGPDGTNSFEHRGIFFVHTLLSMTGKPTVQPFVDAENDIVVLFNGEIYNYLEFGDYESDGQCILPLYRKLGADFIPTLDGEFAIIVIDFSADRMILSTDTFSTKPFWFATEDGQFAMASYASPILRNGFRNVSQLPANTTLIYSISTLKKLEERTVWDFSLDQYKDSYEDWNIAFQNAIRKRTRGIKHGVFIGLSSGYDSGAVACELSRQRVPFTAYSIVGSENTETIKQRISMLENPEYIALNREKFLAARSHLKSHCEEYALRIDNGEQEKLDALKIEYAASVEELNELEKKCRAQVVSKVKDQVRAIRTKMVNIEKRMYRLQEVIEFRRHGQMLTNDNGAIGMSHICGIARSRGELIYLSGSGADEIFSDYGYNGVKHFGHSTIGGHFIDDLSKCFPWKNFFDNTQRAYLMKEEHVTGSYGVEGRYPFLDRSVVQEFLWLCPELKNRHYKAPLHQYLERHDYPFDTSAKVGFNCGFSDSRDGYVEKISSNRNVGEFGANKVIVDFSRWGEDSPVREVMADPIKPLVADRIKRVIRPAYRRLRNLVATLR